MAQGPIDVTCIGLLFTGGKLSMHMDHSRQMLHYFPLVGSKMSNRSRRNQETHDELYCSSQAYMFHTIAEHLVVFDVGVLMCSCKIICSTMIYFVCVCVCVWVSVCVHVYVCNICACGCVREVCVCVCVCAVCGLSLIPMSSFVLSSFL